MSWFNAPLQPRRRLLVDDMRIGQLREEREPPHHPRTRRELRPVDERLAARTLEHPVAVAVAVGLLRSLPGRRAATAHEHHREHRSPHG